MAYNLSKRDIDNPVNQNIKIDGYSISNMDFKTLSKFIHSKDNFTMNLYAICLKKNGRFAEFYFKKTLNYSQIETIARNTTLVQIPFNILRYKKLRDKLRIMDTNFIRNINYENYDLSKHSLVLTFSNLKQDNLKLFVSQFIHKYRLEDYIRLQIMNDYYGITPNHFMIDKMNFILKTMAGSNYWTNPDNCKLNMTVAFTNRNFDFSCLQKLADLDIKKILNEMTKPEQHDYLSYIYDKKKYIDISSSIREKGYSLYNISRIKCDIDKHSLAQLFKSSPQYFSDLTYLMSNRVYSHYIFNNKYILQDLIQWKNKSKLFSFLKYAFLSYYTEETICKSKIDVNDRFVFDIDTASKLPDLSTKEIDYVPFFDNIKYSPYFVLPISKETIDNENIVGCMTHSKICTFDQYKHRMKVFLTGDNIDPFENFEHWDNFAITGSINAAIIPLDNPLYINTKETGNKKLLNFFDSYYKNSDVDIMCNETDWLSYINKTLDLAKRISINLSNNSTTEFNKTACIIVNENFVKKYIVPTTSKTYLEICLNITEPEIKQLFYEWYVKYQLLENEKHITSSIWMNPDYNSLFEVIPLKNVNILIKKSNDDWKKINMNHKPINYNNDYNFKFPDDNMLCSVNINLKTHIYNTKLKHKLEVFRCKCKNFFGLIHRFHLPCVRAYYQKDNVYMLPSAITAYKTGINMDYKYFAGSRDPIEIINKYRFRGYTTVLNKREIVHFLDYSLKVEKWKNMYNIKTITGCKKILGYLNPNHHFYKTSTSANKNLPKHKFYTMPYHRDIFNSDGFIKQMNLEE